MYNVYLYSIMEDKKNLLNSFDNRDTINKFIYDYVVKTTGREALYYRGWIENNIEYCDYGSHIYWIMIENTEENGKN